HEAELRASGSEASLGFGGWALGFGGSLGRFSIALCVTPHPRPTPPPPPPIPQDHAPRHQVGPAVIPQGAALLARSGAHAGARDRCGYGRGRRGGGAAPPSAAFRRASRAGRRLGGPLPRRP